MGTITELGDGRYRIRAQAGKDHKGNYRQRSRVVDGKRKAQAELRRLEQEIEEELAGQLAPSAETVGFLLDTWLADRELEGLAQRTVKGYRHYFSEAKAHFGEMPLNRFEQDGRDVAKKFYKHLAQDRHLSGRSIDHYHRALHAAFAYAVDEKWVRLNPFTGLKGRPPALKAEIKPPTVDQVRKILTVRNVPTEYQMFVQFAYDTWCRPGETMAMRWDRVNFEQGTVLIENATDLDKSLKDTKAHQKRLIAITARTLDDLRAYQSWLRQNGRGCEEEALLFATDPEGLHAWHPSKATAVWRMFMRRTKLKGIRLYDLRHFGATQALAAGMPIAQVSYRLGHQRISTTFDHYNHFIPHRDRDVATFMGELMAPTTKELTE